MISKLVADNVLGGHKDFPIASETKALDDKLEEALISLSLDVKGRLVQSLSVQGMWTRFHLETFKAEKFDTKAIFKSFESAWSDFLAEWLDACSASGDCEEIHSIHRYPLTVIF